MRPLFRGLGKLLRGLRTLWLILGATLLVAAVVELSLRGVMRFKRAGDRAEAAAASGYRGAPWARQHVDELMLDVQMAWRPYIYWRAAPWRGRTIQIGADGLRRTVPTKAAPPAATAKKQAIWLFGGSVVFGWGARDEHTITSELAGELAMAGHAVDVINYGQIGYVSTQDVLALHAELREGRRPSAVVFIDGYNDLMSALAEAQAGIPLNEENRRQEFNIRPAGLLLAEADGSATMWLVKGLLRRAGLRQDPRDRPGRADRPAVEALAAGVVDVYADNVRLVEQDRAAYGFEALYYWQPVSFWKKRLVGDERAAAQQWPAMKDLQAQVRQRIVATPALADNPRFHDLVGFFDDSPEAFFIDTCHISEAGNLEVAKRIAADLVPLFVPATHIPLGPPGD